LDVSSALCRAQEAAQRDRAATSPLVNVRIQAEKAAIAWGVEALAAEQREARHARTRVIAQIAAVEHQRGDEGTM